jgi:hypothetical protein
LSRKICDASIGVEHLDVRQVMVGDEAPGALHVLGTALKTDDVAREPSALGEQIETAAWAATNFDYSPPWPHANLVKEPRCIMCQFERLSLQALLLRLPITEERNGFVHFSPP